MLLPLIVVLKPLIKLLVKLMPSALSLLVPSTTVPTRLVNVLVKLELLAILVIATLLMMLFVKLLTLPPVLVLGLLVTPSVMPKAQRDVYGTVVLVLVLMTVPNTRLMQHALQQLVNAQLKPLQLVLTTLLPVELPALVKPMQTHALLPLLSATPT